MRPSRSCAFIVLAAGVVLPACGSPPSGSGEERTTLALQSNGSFYTNVTASFPALADTPSFRLAAADVDKNGYPDILAYSTSLTDYKLLLNDGGVAFRDFTATSSIRSSRRGTLDRRSSFGLFLDVDNDGDLDLFSGLYGHRLADYQDNGDRNDLLLNNGGGIFTLSSASRFHTEKLWNTSGAVPLDYDKDGFLDLFIVNWYNEAHTAGMGDQLYRGRGGTFQNVTAAMGLSTPPNRRPRYGVSTADANNDGRMDLFVGTYCDARSLHWENRGSSFVEVGSTSRFGASVGVSGTCSWGEIPRDFDNDGDMDFFEILVHGSDGGPRSGILLNDGDGPFETRPFTSAVRTTDPEQGHDGDHQMAWTDIDNDGLVDVVLTESGYGNDRIYVFAQRPDHSFEDVTTTSGLHAINVNPALAPHNVIPVDYDRDGDEDLLVGFASGQPPQLWRNDAGGANYWVAVDLQGLGGPGASNRSGVGAKIIVFTDVPEAEFSREVGGGHGNFAPQAPYTAIIGTGAARPTSVRVEWRNAVNRVDEASVGLNGYVTLVERTPLVCRGVSGGWQGCRGSGCSVCSNLIADYPLYLRNHPACTLNKNCGGQAFACSANCPPPTSADTCSGSPGGWQACRGNGCSVCAEQVDTNVYPLYFKNHPGCVPNPNCGGQYFPCNSNCPAPTEIDACSGTPGNWDGCRGNGCAVCSELVKDYPRYFINHPYCVKNDICDGLYFTCNANCPAPTEDDR